MARAGGAKEKARRASERVGRLGMVEQCRHSCWLSDTDRLKLHPAFIAWPGRLCAVTWHAADSTKMVSSSGHSPQHYCGHRDTRAHSHGRLIFPVKTAHIITMRTG